MVGAYRGAMLAILGFVSSASADWIAPGCLEPSPIYRVRFVELAPPICCPLYATPTPAPSSTLPPVAQTPSKEPPLGKAQPKGPIVDHYRSIGGVMQNLEPRLPQCKVSFWNLTGAEVTLTVGDRIHVLAKDRAVVLTLDRAFTWRTNFIIIPKNEHVPDDRNDFEVLIR